MDVKIFDLEKKSEDKISLPSQFNESVRPDLISRAVLAFQLSRRHPYGAKVRAGTRVSAQVSRRRRAYRGSYGKGISRVPRKIMTRRGAQISWQGAQAPGTVGGRRAHPPKAFKNWTKKINNKENMQAIRSALAASMEKSYVNKRGHITPEDYPFAVDDKISTLKKTKNVKETLVTLGLGSELKRTAKKSIRAGRGKTRGRKYIKKIGPLIIVNKNCPLQKSAASIPGVEVVLAENLNAEVLAPGTAPGRLTLFTTSAINKIKKEKLFT